MIRGIKERLLANYGEALERFALWSPLFLGAWLSSGFVLTDVTALSLISLPLLFQFLFRTRTKVEEIFLETQVLTFLRILPFISALYLFSEKARPDLSICLILSGLFLEGYFYKSKIAWLSLFIKPITSCLFMASNSQMGIASQIPFKSLEETFFGYFIMGLIPGTVIAGRQFLLHAEEFSELGWQLGSVRKVAKDGSEKELPSRYTKLVMFSIIIGPAIPALLIPFNILPKAFLSSSLIFFVLPKLAEKIQNTKDPELLKITSISVTMLALGLQILLFLSTLIGI